MQQDIILTSVSRKELTSLITDTIYDALSIYTERNPLKSEKNNFTKREAAAELSCSVPMIDKLIQQGRLDKVKVGAKVLIPREGIERILNNKKGSNYAK